MATDPFKKKKTVFEKIQEAKAREERPKPTKAPNQGLGTGKARGPEDALVDHRGRPIIPAPRDSSGNLVPADIEFQGMTRPRGDLTTEQIADLRNRKAFVRTKDVFDITREGKKARTPEEQAQLQESEVLREEFADEAEAKGRTLLQKATDKPDLTPPPVLETTAAIGLELPVNAANALTGVLERATGQTYGRTGVEEYAKTPIGKLLGNVALAAAGTLAVVTGQAAYGYVASTAAATSLTTSTLATSKALNTGGFGSIVKLGAVGAVGTAGFKTVKGFTSIPRQRIDVQMKILGKMVEGGERIVAFDRAGLPPNKAIDKLDVMSAEIDFSEQTIKELGQYDIKYRTSQEYLFAMTQIGESRSALGRRYEEVATITRTGTAALDPDALMLLAGEELKAAEELKALSS